MDTIKLKNAIRESWNQYAIKYDGYAGHGIQSTRESELWKNEFRKAFPGEELAILDVGCGTGAMSLLCAEMGHYVTGIDLSEKMLAKGRAKAASRGLAVELLTGDAEQTTFPDNSFDVVINRHLLWTLPHPKDALYEWHRVIKPEGHVVVIDGVWNDGRFSTRIRRRTSDFLAGIIEGRDKVDSSYSDAMRKSLPHDGGVPLGMAETYLKEAEFSGIKSSNLLSITDLKRTSIPWYRKLSYKWSYYLIHGTKTR